MLYLGQVDWYGAKKINDGNERVIPYGFIKHKDHPEGIFFHKSNLGDDFLPKPDDWVVFYTEEGRDGKVAASKVKKFNIHNLLNEKNEPLANIISDNDITMLLKLDEFYFYAFSKRVLEINLEKKYSLDGFFLKNIHGVFNTNKELLDFSKNDGFLDFLIFFPEVFEGIPFSFLKGLDCNNYVTYATKNSLLDFIFYFFRFTSHVSEFDSVMTKIFFRANEEDFLEEFRERFLFLLGGLYREKKDFMIYFLSKSKLDGLEWMDSDSRLELIFIFLTDFFSGTKNKFKNFVTSELNDDEFYKNFDQKNFDLINGWISYEAGKINKDFLNKSFTFEQIKMMSARVAEIFTQEVFKKEGFQVEDIAIQQVEGALGKSHEWSIFDFKACNLENELLIDVKNARSSVGGKDLYSEFCVPRFKKNRDDKNVIIAGVYSPYYTKEEVLEKIGGKKNSSFGRKKQKNLKFMGVTYLNHQLNLIDFFCNKKELLEGLSFDRGGKDSYLPVWIFSYPKYFFHADAAVFSKDIIGQFSSVLFLNDLKSVCQNNFQKETFDCHILLSKKVVVEVIFFKILSFGSIRSISDFALDLNLLKDYELDFYSILSEASVFTKKVDSPVIFLSILTHFLKNLSRTDFDFFLYEDIVERFSGLDIMGALKKIVGILKKIYNGKDLYGFANFKIFKLQGGSLLQGRLNFSDKKNKTLVAYCGGFINPKNQKTITSLSENFKSRCGYEPLLITDHQSCPSCYKLICPECHTCAIGCIEMTSRIKKIEEAKKLEEIERQNSVDSRGEPPKPIWSGYE